MSNNSNSGNVDSNSNTSSNTSNEDIQTQLTKILTEILKDPTLHPPSVLSNSNPVKKIIPKNMPPSDRIDVLETVDNGNLNEITVIYNGFAMNNIKITGLTFDSKGKQYTYNNGTLNDGENDITDNNMKNASKYLASLNLSFYTDPNRIYSIS